MPAPDGNEVHTKRIADQMFDAWEAKQDERIKDRSARFAGSLPAWFGVVASVGGILWAAAFLAGDVDENRRRIDELESDMRLQSASNQQVIERLASIEAKLDLITEERAR